MSPFSCLFCLPQPTSASMNFGKKKKKEKKKVGKKKTLHKIGRIVVCLSCVTSGNNYLMTTNPLNLQV